MSPPSPPTTRRRSALPLGHAEQNLLLRVDATPQVERVEQAQKAARTVACGIVKLYPAMPREQQVDVVRTMLEQLGVRADAQSTGAAA